jgi:ankyrin repeat protein
MRGGLAQETEIPVRWVQGLACYGISSTHQDQSGNTPLNEEEKGLFPRTISFLKKAGCDFHVVNSQGQNLLHVIAQSVVQKRGYLGDPAPQRSLILFKEFVAYGLDPSVQDMKGCTALVG